MKDRRSEPRIPFRCPISIKSREGRSCKGQIQGLSHHGVQAIMETEVVPLGPVWIRIDATDGRPPFTIETKGEVVWSDGKGGVGLHLEEDAEESLDHLRYLIDLNLGVPAGCEEEEEYGGNVLYWYSKSP